jgi:hypothetical protein
MNPIHFSWLGELFKQTYFDFQVHFSKQMHSKPPWQQENYISHICMCWNITPQKYFIVQNNKLWILKNIYNIEKVQYEKAFHNNKACNTIPLSLGPKSILLCPLSFLLRPSVVGNPYGISLSDRLNDTCCSDMDLCPSNRRWVIMSWFGKL